MLLAAPLPALAQAGLGQRGFDADRIDARQPRPPGGVALPAAPVPAAAAPALPDIAIADVAVAGLPEDQRGRLRDAVLPFIGQRLATRTLGQLTAAVVAALRAGDIATFDLTLPEQDFAQGLVVFRFLPGRVAEIAFEGEIEGTDLSLTRAYAEAIRAEAPLRTSTLERYLLLMNQTPGRRVEARLEPIGPGAQRLVLNLRPTLIRFGFGLDNLGARELGDVQATLGATLFGLLREGDSTRVTVGAPTDLRLFRYYALRHQQPIGTDGATIAISASALDIRRTDRNALEGQAYALGLQAVLPLVRAARQSVDLFAAFDTTDNTTSIGAIRNANEATRVLRAGVSAAYRSEALGTSFGAAIVASNGIDGLGARQNVAAYGGPEFQKVSLQLFASQPLFDNALVLRLRGTAQAADRRLPASEQLTYGGVAFGSAFRGAVLAGDDGLAGSVTLALPLRDRLGLTGLAGEIAARTELYGFVDAARTATREPILPPRGNHAAAGGLGVAVALRDETALNVELARVLVQPRNRAPLDDTRLVVAIRRNF
jgi:hemolysin activation/secretion protein